MGRSRLELGRVAKRRVGQHLYQKGYERSRRVAVRVRGDVRVGVDIKVKGSCRSRIRRRGKGRGRIRCRGRGGDSVHLLVLLAVNQPRCSLRETIRGCHVLVDARITMVPSSVLVDGLVNEEVNKEVNKKGDKGVSKGGGKGGSKGVGCIKGCDRT